MLYRFFFWKRASHVSAGTGGGGGWGGVRSGSRLTRARANVASGLFLSLGRLCRLVGGGRSAERGWSVSGNADLLNALVLFSAAEKPLWLCHQSSLV